MESQYKELASIEAQQLYYYEVRSRYNSFSNSDLEKSLLLIFLNKTCFNGLYRENSKGGFNVPFGKYANPTICNESNLRLVANKLKDANISCGSFETAITEATNGDFIYFDPPYYPINTTSSFTSYHADGFNEKHQVLLKEVFKSLSDKNCKVMLSNSDTPFINELYAEFNIHKVYAGRAINSVASKRGMITEVVVTNY
jgi:DNA adenine methylase